MTMTMTVPASVRPMRNAMFALLGALALGACSSMPKIDGISDSITSVFGSNKPQVEASPASQAAPAPSVDFATSTEVHPEIWPLGQSGEPRDPAIEAQVAALLSKMTLEEKVGQMLQPDINTITPDEVRQYHIGSILNGGDSGPGGELRAPAAEWLKAADAYYNASIDVPAGHAVVPIIWGIDAIHGQDHIIGATLFPQNIALGAMNDPTLVKKADEVTAEEMRVTGQDWTFAPTIAVVRDDRWGRSYEGFSESADRVTEATTAMIEGLQGMPGTPEFLNGDHVIATAKHYIGDGGTDGGRNAGNNLYGEPELRDLFAPPYEAAIKAGVQTVMVSYSSWRGQKMHANKGLITDVLIKRLGFDGFVVSDWQGFAEVPGCSGTDCPASINAGIDMFMGPADWKTTYANILSEVKSGVIPMARLDEAVGRILRVKLRAGVMTEGKPSSRPRAGQYDLIGSPDHLAVARQAVRESLVLLKNDAGLLPLSPKAHVLVAGDGAESLTKQMGGWTISWQGYGNTPADFPHATTIFQGIKQNVEAAGGTATLSVDGSFTQKPDVAIVVFGENPYAEGVGDRPDVDFQPGNRRALKLLQSLRAQGIPVVSVFISGRPLYVTPEINASNAFVAAWLPGSEGEGISDVLFSKPDGAVAYDFRGTLPFSWPRAPDQTPLNVGTSPYDPLFAYGYGLRYETPGNLGALPEAKSEPAILADTLSFVDAGHAMAPWSFALIGSKDAIANVGSLQAPGGALKISTAHSDAQSDLLMASWTGKGSASLALMGANANVDWQANEDMALSLRVRVAIAPTRQVTLAMANGPNKLSKVDLTAALREALGKGWTTLQVRLPCFKSAGADLRTITAPMMLTTAGKLAIDLDFVKVTEGTGASSCPVAAGM